MSEVGKNPNDSLPKGKPLDPDTIVSEDDAGSAAIEKEVAEERDEQASRDEFEGLDNDLVNVGKFTADPDDDGLGPVDEDEDEAG